MDMFDFYEWKRFLRLLKMYLNGVCFSIVCHFQSVCYWPTKIVHKSKGISPNNFSNDHLIEK